MILKSGEFFTITWRIEQERYDSLRGLVFLLRIGLEISDGHIMERSYEIFTPQDSFANTFLSGEHFIKHC
jgi:hypothetical protein